MTSNKTPHAIQPNRIHRAFLGMAVALTALWFAPPVRAGNHPDSTWLPATYLPMTPGANSLRITLPHDQNGVVRQAILLLSKKTEQMTSPPQVPGMPPPPPRDPTLPITLKLTCDGRLLPEWVLSDSLEGYVISWETIASNPGFGQGELWLEAVLDAAGPGAIDSVGSPDLLICKLEGFDGSLFDFAALAPAGALRQYFTGMTHHVAGDYPRARGVFESLVASDNADVARFSRRGLRLLEYQMRPRPDPRDFGTGRRTMVYLEQIGLFGMSRVEGAWVGPYDPEASDIYWRHSEIAEQLGANVFKVGRLCGQAAMSAAAPQPVRWNVLHVMLDEEIVGADAVRLTHDQMNRAYDSWLSVEQMATGAAFGAIEFRTDYLYVADTKTQGYITRDGVTGPTDDLFDIRGDYDLVISVRPGGRNVAGGPDVGPNGAAIIDVDPDTDWRALLERWFDVYAWTLRATEAGPVPAVPDAMGGPISWGIRPVPSRQYGLRAALHYGITSGMYRRALLSAPPVEDAYLPMWRLTALRAAEPATMDESRSVIDITRPLNDAESALDQPVAFLADEDFVDLRAIDPAKSVESGMARAACWIHSPVNQSVTMWLGFSDGATVRLNGRIMHRGDYRAAGQWATHPRPDMVATTADLGAGWNHLEIDVLSRGGPWGFSARFADEYNRDVIALGYSITPPPEAECVQPRALPAAGEHFDWATAGADWYDELPRLDDAELEAITGIKGISVSAALAGQTGRVAITVAGRENDPVARYRVPPEQWIPLDHNSGEGRDLDRTLNNIMDGSRENVAILPYTRDGHTAAIMLVRPESIRPYLEFLRESRQAVDVFDGAPPWRRILGYVEIPTDVGTRHLIAVDVMIGLPPEWPIDEEDLLVLPRPNRRVPAAVPASAAATQPAVPDAAGDSSAP